MKISDIITENPAQKSRDDLTVADIQQLYSDNPDLLRAIQQAFAHPKVKTWGDAVDVGTARYYASLRKAQPTKQRPDDTDRKDAATPKEPTARRVSKFDQFGKSGKSGLFKGAIDKVKDLPGIKQFGQGWEAGADLAADLGVPKTKRK